MFLSIETIDHLFFLSENWSLVNSDNILSFLGVWFIFCAGCILDRGTVNTVKLCTTSYVNMYSVLNTFTVFSATSDVNRPVITSQKIVLNVKMWTMVGKRHARSRLNLRLLDMNRINGISLVFCKLFPSRPSLLMDVLASFGICALFRLGNRNLIQLVDFRTACVRANSEHRCKKRVCNLTHPAAGAAAAAALAAAAAADCRSGQSKFFLSVNCEYFVLLFDWKLASPSYLIFINNILILFLMSPQTLFKTN